MNGSQVLYDPDDDAEGFRLNGDDPVALAKEWEGFSAEVNSISERIGKIKERLDTLH